MIGVVATLQIQPGKQPEFETLFTDLAAQVVQESGNRLYRLCKCRNGDRHYVVMELYESEVALELHRNSPHMLEVRPRLASILAAPPQIEVLDILA